MSQPPFEQYRGPPFYDPTSRKTTDQFWTSRAASWYSPNAQRPQLPSSSALNPELYPQPYSNLQFMSPNWGISGDYLGSSANDLVSLPVEALRSSADASVINRGNDGFVGPALSNVSGVLEEDMTLASSGDHPHLQSQPPVRASKTVQRAWHQRAGGKLVNSGSVTKIKPATSTAACPQCGKMVKTPQMRQHTMKTHTRTYRCILGRYGCQARFGAKNEWKRHITSQHLQLQIWRCDFPTCQPAMTMRGDASMEYNDFNRKDLFVQHLHRIHDKPKDVRRSPTAVTELDIVAITERCQIQQRQPPNPTSCTICPEPAKSTLMSWEHYIDHLAKHFDEISGLVPPFDSTLHAWLIKQDLIHHFQGRWILRQSSLHADILG